MSLLIGKALKVLKLQLKDYFYFFFLCAFIFSRAGCWAVFESLLGSMFYTCDVQGLYKVILKQDATYCGSIM